MHTPVLLKETIDSLNIQSLGKYIDATLGEGGHAEEIIKRGGVVLGIDWDQNQIDRRVSKNKSGSIKFVRGNYADIGKIARENDFFPVDGVIFDLGLSMEQLSSNKRGFSYKKLKEPLDMRIGNELETTAADLLNSLEANELYDLLARYSEELDSKLIAEAIANKKGRQFEEVGDLVEVVKKTLSECKQRHQHDINKTLARVFQALRITVNNEFENIKKGLAEAVEVTKIGGVVAIITFHSLEDRVVKQFIRKNQLRSEHTVRGSKELAFERSATLRIIHV